MNRILQIALILIFPIIGQSQNINVTFLASSDSIAVDSVLATNLNTDQSIMLPGDKTLILEQSSGINTIPIASDRFGFYPNPFIGSATIKYTQFTPGEVALSVHNHIGQLVYQTEKYLNVGEHSFILKLNKAGVYFYTVYDNEGIHALKAICTQSNYSSVEIIHTGHTASDFKSVLSSPEQYKLAYTPDQVMHFTCYGGKYTTIFTDTVEASINYDVEFHNCTDPDGRTYSVVEIGNQVWMEENLGYLPYRFEKSATF